MEERTKRSFQSYLWKGFFVPEREKVQDFFGRIRESCYFCSDSDSPRWAGGLNSYWKKDVNETLSSASRSRKSKAQKKRNLSSMLGVLYPSCRCFSKANASSLYNTSRRGLSRVAYPEQGNARARMWDKRGVRATHVFRLLLSEHY